MSNELEQYLIGELGLEPKPQRRAGLERAVDALLGVHLQQRTPIQQQAIEPIYDGADVLLVSATASGKTEAAVIPIAARLLSDSDRSVALYVAPTRALLNDLYRRLEAPLCRLGLQPRIRHGDYPLPANTEGIRILFITPESLDVLLSSGHESLQRVRYAILDEIHQLFGTPRGSQLMFCLERLEYSVKHPIQRVALSATVGDPRDIARWLRPGGAEARIIQVPGGRRINAQFRWLSDPCLLAEWLRDARSDKTLYFVNSRRKCDEVYLALRQVKPYECFVHYSTLSKAQREYVETGFKTAGKAVCVATTTLELGVDIGSIEAVALVDPPTTIRSFLQRTGRGGRRGDHIQVTLMPRNALQMLQFSAMVQLAEEGCVEASSAGRPYSVLVQQLFSIIAGKHKLNLHPADLLERFENMGWLGTRDVELILDKLVDDQLLRRKLGSKIHEVGANLESLIHKSAIFSNISGQSAGVPVFHGGRLLANLPLRSDQMEIGKVILYAGRFWRIITVSERGLTVDLAQPVPQPVRPLWSSKGAFSVSSILAAAMQRHLVAPPDHRAHDLDRSSAIQLQTLCGRTREAGGQVDTVWRERVGDTYVYYTFAGGIENQILRILFESLGFSCRMARRAEGIAITSKDRLDFGLLPDSTDEIARLVEHYWRDLDNWVECGPYFRYLPAALRRSEIVSLVPRPAVESMVRFSGTPVISVPLGLVR